MPPYVAALGIYPFGLSAAFCIPAAAPVSSTPNTTPSFFNLLFLVIKDFLWLHARLLRSQGALPCCLCDAGLHHLFVWLFCSPSRLLSQCAS